MSSEEADLIKRAKRGEAAAFAEIYDRCQPAIYRYVFYQLHDVHAAEDVTGEVFVRLVEKIDQFTYRGHPLLAWLYTIARNLVRDYQRRTARTPTLPITEWQIVSEDAPAPEARTERKLTQRRLADAITHLTEGQRQVILLKFIEGLDNATVAQTMGKSVGAVKALQHRGLAALRRILEREEG